MLKRLLIFLLIVALLAGAILLFAWWRGETEAGVGGQTTRGIIYIIFWAVGLSLIGFITRWIISKKKP